MKEKLITIIIPVYNVQDYLEECIESAINQSYKNLEIILINDGSKDDSGQICQKFADKDNRIVYIDQENKGVAQTRNIGLKSAKGEYVFFLDSDDWITFNTIKELYSQMNKNNAQMGIANKERFFDKVDLENKEPIEITSRAAREVLEMLLARELSSYMTGILYRSEIIKEIEFPIYSCHEDQAVFYKIIANCKNVIFTSEKMYKYRDNKSSITNTINIKKCKERYESIHLLANGIVEIEPKLRKSANEYLYFNCIDILLSFNTKTDLEFYKKVLEEIKYLENHVDINKFAKKEKLKVNLFKINPTLARLVFHIYRKLKNN